MSLFFEDPLPEEIEVSENQAAALTLIIALSQNVSATQVNITSIVTNNNALNVKAHTFVLLNGYFVNFNEQSIATYIGANQNSSIVSLKFDTIMAQVETIYNDEVFYTVTHSSFSNPSVVTIIEPANHRAKKHHISGGDIAAAVIMTIFGFILLVSLVWYVTNIQYNTDNNHKQETTNEKQENFVDSI